MARRGGVFSLHLEDVLWRAAEASYVHACSRLVFGCFVLVERIFFGWSVLS